MAFELPYGLSAADVQPGTTNEYWDGVRAAYEAAGHRLAPIAAEVGPLAGASEVDVDMVSVEPAPAPGPFGVAVYA